MQMQSDRTPPPPEAGAVASAQEQRISEVISEFSEVFAFARSRWASYADEVHPDLKGVGIMVLQLIIKKGPVTATGISQMLDMDKALVSRQLSRLRELDLVQTEPSAEDRRVVLLTPTPQARELLDRIRERWAHAYHERFDSWSVRDLELLRDGLHRFNASAHDFQVEGPAGRCTRDHRDDQQGGAGDEA
ncbi:MAG: MarR family winged helix-turn-helix transcriptional regulator [Leucobacter sp.]